MRNPRIPRYLDLETADCISIELHQRRKDPQYVFFYYPYSPNQNTQLGQKSPFKLQEIWAIRTRLQLASKTRDLALFNLAIDSKLRGCDLVSLRLRDVFNCGRDTSRATTIQRKTGRPVQFEITVQTRSALASWIDKAHLIPEDYLFLQHMLMKDALYQQHVDVCYQTTCGKHMNS